MVKYVQGLDLGVGVLATLATLALIGSLHYHAYVSACTDGLLIVIAAIIFWGNRVNHQLIEMNKQLVNSHNAMVDRVSGQERHIDL